MITIIYDPNPDTPAFSPRDGQINEFADIIQMTAEENNEIGGEVKFIVANFILIDEIRARIAEGKIDYKNIQFKFGENILKTDKNGRIENWPSGFGDIWDNILWRLIE